MQWRQRIYANIAIRLAFEHPAEAEDVLNQLEEPTWRIDGARGSVEGSSAMTWARARADRRLAPDPSKRAYAWTFLADGLSTSDRTAASAALDQALREIDRRSPRYLQSLRPEPGRIDPTAGRTDRPERVAEFFWQRWPCTRPWTTRVPTSAGTNRWPARRYSFPI